MPLTNYLEDEVLMKPINNRYPFFTLVEVSVENEYTFFVVVQPRKNVMRKRCVKRIVANEVKATCDVQKFV